MGGERRKSGMKGFCCVSYKGEQRSTLALVLPQGCKRPTELGSNSHRSEERNPGPGAQDFSATTGSIDCSDFEFFELCTVMLIKHKLSEGIRTKMLRYSL